MNNKIVFITIFGIVVVGLMVGFILPASKQNIPVENQPSVQTSTENVSAESKPTVTSAPTPTWPPFAMKIDRVDETFIYIVDDKGKNVRLTKEKVKIFRRNGDKLVPLAITEAKSGQPVTVNVTAAGKETQLIIEN